MLSQNVNAPIVICLRGSYMNYMFTAISAALSAIFFMNFTSTNVVDELVVLADRHKPFNIFGRQNMQA